MNIQLILFRIAKFHIIFTSHECYVLSWHLFVKLNCNKYIPFLNLIIFFILNLLRIFLFLGIVCPSIKNLSHSFPLQMFTSFFNLATKSMAPRIYKSVYIFCTYICVYLCTFIYLSIFWVHCWFNYHCQANEALTK